MQDPSFWTRYQPQLRLVDCACGWSRTVVDDDHAERLLDEHTFAHSAVEAAL